MKRKPDRSALRIAAQLRKRMLLKQLAPGQKLPPRIDLGRELQASAGTVQEAIDLLVEEGYLHTRPRQGTFVRVDAPHLKRFGLVFPQTPGDLLHSPFCTAIRDHALALQAEEGVEFVVFYGIDFETHDAYMHKLMDAVFEHRLAGLFFAAPPHYLHQQCNWSLFSMPKVAISTEYEPWIPVVTCQYDSFYKEAIRLIAEDGRRSVAHITQPQAMQYDRLFQQTASEAGLEHRKMWTQFAYPESLPNLVTLLFNPQQVARPEALLIGDDALLEPTLIALAGVGMSIPQDLLVVSHANFPRLNTGQSLVRRVGFDTRKIIRAAISGLNYQLDGNEPESIAIEAECDGRNNQNQNSSTQ